MESLFQELSSLFILQRTFCPYFFPWCPCGFFSPTDSQRVAPPCLACRWSFHQGRARGRQAQRSLWACGWRRGGGWSPGRESCRTTGTGAQRTKCPAWAPPCQTWPSGWAARPPPPPSTRPWNCSSAPSCPSCSGTCWSLLPAASPEKGFKNEVCGTGKTKSPYRNNQSSEVVGLILRVIVVGKLED